jgi:hypothetical protein
MREFGHPGLESTPVFRDVSHTRVDHHSRAAFPNAKQVQAMSANINTLIDLRVACNLAGGKKWQGQNNCY